MSLLSNFLTLLTPGPHVTAADAAARVRSGQALLVDVREPAEWADGVAATAALLPLSDLTGHRREWHRFLSKVAGREVLLYCASGMRSGSAARILAAEGVKAANAGRLGDWQSAGWLIVKPHR